MRKETVPRRCRGGAETVLGRCRDGVGPVVSGQCRAGVGLVSGRCRAGGGRGREGYLDKRCNKRRIEHLLLHGSLA